MSSARRMSRMGVVAILAVSMLAVAGPGVASTCEEGFVELSGTVTRDLDGGLLKEVTSVGIFAVDGSFADGAATTLPSSTYSACVPVNKDYRVGFQADHYLIEWYDNVLDMASATPAVVATSDVTGIDASLGQTTISGRVTDQRTGAPLFASVSVVNADTGVGYDNEGTDPSGVYTLTVPPGRWVVAFAVDYHWSEWFDNTKKFSKADVIEVTQTTPSFTGIDARLRLCSRTVPDFCFPKHYND
jgi:hypothetical protein